MPIEERLETQFYVWKQYRCAYDIYSPDSETSADAISLLLIHPIGVGLSRHFWHRFCRQWLQSGHLQQIYNPDLLGCGESDMPHIAYKPEDWAEQLHYFLETVVQKPTVLIVQGALLPVALALVHRQAEAAKTTGWVQGLVLAGPPAWAVMTQGTPVWRQQVVWNLLNSPFGRGFYRYARRRQFLQSFSTRELFAEVKDVDAGWLDMLEAGATNPASRHAVFSFLAGFWRQDYEVAIAAVHQPTLVVVGEQASSISRRGQAETPEQRLTNYLEHLSEGHGLKSRGRNVLPYESTAEFVAAIANFVSSFNPKSR